MKNFFGSIFLTGAVLWGGGVVTGQTHKVASPQTVVRAVGVYEWTGDMAKPTASRLIPVTVFIDGKLEDAGEYLARPVPFALLSGNVYELQQSGVAKGTLSLVYAKHLQAEDAKGDAVFDDGWFGYGSYQGLAAGKKASALKPSKTLAVVKSSGDGDKPHFSNKDGGTADPDRPTMKRQGSGDGGSDTGSKDAGVAKTDSSAPADDPDRPTMKRKDSSDAGSDTASTKVDVPEDDADRPTLKRRSPEQIKKDGKREDSASVSGVGSLNDDPSRPNLHRGKPASAMTEADLPKLTGMPVDLRQMVAVSDAATRDTHDFARAWADDTERKAVLTKMEVLAQKRLLAYNGGMAAAAAAAKPVGKRPVNSKLHHAVGPEIVPAVPVVEEELKAYTLSYGAAATYVYSAHTVGAGAGLEYVTEVAQADPAGELRAAIESVTDAAHLDRTPRMRLVDAVDAESSNRASLLFELRGQVSRQFGLYRVIGSRAEQIFLSGSTQ